MKTVGIVICSRLDSKRIPFKAIANICGVPLINRLANKCKTTGLKTVIAVPHEERPIFESAAPSTEIFSDPDLDKESNYCPMRRMHAAAKKYGFKHIFRVSHDKLFIESEVVLAVLSQYMKGGLDYLGEGDFTEGSRVELFSVELLEKAIQEFGYTEHVRYALKTVSKRQETFKMPKQLKSGHRFFVDYPEDFQLMKLLFENGCDNLKSAIDFMERHPFLASINRQPLITVYTCSYNSEEWIERAMKSVFTQDMYLSRLVEYIVVDDCSTDSTTAKVALSGAGKENFKSLRNRENYGLATSSNIALSHARGTYVVRLDADDFFTSSESLDYLFKRIVDTNKDVIYPNNYFGSLSNVQKGDVKHHVGGAIFNREALEFFRFKNGLRGYEGYDLFQRAKGKLDVGYLNRPVFYYRQHDSSMSNTNTEERAKIKEEIDAANTAYPT